MAAPKKRVLHAQEIEHLEDEDGEMEDDGMSEDETSDQEQDEMMDQVVQIDFEAREAQDEDFHGIRKLLQQLFLKAHINVSELADTIISQNYVGSVLKQISDDADVSDSGDEDDAEMEVFGVMSAINITERKDLEFVGQVKTMLVNQCKECAPEKVSQLNARLSTDSKHIGLLISERFINIPPQMAAPSYDSLRTDIKNAVKRKMKYKFDELLLISKIYKAKPVDGGKKKKGTVNEAASFINPEEELFSQEASFTFDYSVANEHDSIGEEEEEMLPWRRVMFVPADKLDKINEIIRQSYSS